MPRLSSNKPDPCCSCRARPRPNTSPPAHTSIIAHPLCNSPPSGRPRTRACCTCRGASCRDRASSCPTLCCVVGGGCRQRARQDTQQRIHGQHAGGATDQHAQHASMHWCNSCCTAGVKSCDKAKASVLMMHWYTIYMHPNSLGMLGTHSQQRHQAAAHPHTC